MLCDSYLFLILCGQYSQLKEISGLSSLKYFLPAHNSLFQGCKGSALWLRVAHTHLSSPTRNLHGGRGRFTIRHWG